jgi:hypothetical protein
MMQMQQRHPIQQRPTGPTNANEIAKIQAWISENPHRKRTVLPIEIRIVSDTQEGEEVPSTLPGGWSSTPLEPPGPVSLYLWKTNPEFRAGSFTVRRTILRETILVLHERVDKELRGIKWQRKKVLEQLSAQQTSAVSPPMDTPELDKALCHLLGYQKVIVDEAGSKKIQFFPENPQSWSADFPVWGSSIGARAVLHKAGEEPVSRGLALWLQGREDEGWSIRWPIAEGTLEEIRSKLLQRGLRCNPRIEKPKKADYAEVLGRAEAVSHLSSLSFAE